MRSPLFLLALLFLTTGCRFFKGDPYRNTPVSGKTAIAADETLRPVMEAEIELFRGIYGYAEITAGYLPEKQTFDLLVKDSVQLIIATRQLNAEETERINRNRLFPKQLKVATDAIALVVHPSCKDSLISLDQIRDILAGKISNWNQLNPSLPGTPIRVLFDNQHSGIVRYMADSICHGNFLASHASALADNVDVIDYTASHPGVLGFIGVSWISNKNDSLHLSFHKKIRVLSVSASEISTVENSYKPYQAYLLEKMYPLRRPVYMITTEPRSGLCTGMVSFVAGDKGQRVILKSGLVPAVAPSRVVNIRSNL